MSKAKFKIGGQQTQLKLFRHYRGFLETFVEQNPCTAILNILKHHGINDISVGIEWCDMSRSDRSKVISRIRHLRSVTLVHQHGDEAFCFQLNSGYPFLEGFLLELEGALGGRYGYKGSFNPRLCEIAIIDEHGNPIHEVIDSLARTRVWMVCVGNVNGYDKTIEIMRTCGADMTAKSAMHVMRLTELTGVRLPYGGLRVTFSEKETAEAHSHYLDGHVEDDAFVLVEITDK